MNEKTKAPDGVTQCYVTQIPALKIQDSAGRRLFEK
jgi:hypothetical protein